MKPKFYTEFRIPHKTVEEKQKFENKLDEVLTYQGYKSRIEWIREKYRELMKGESK